MFRLHICGFQVLGRQDIYLDAIVLARSDVVREVGAATGRAIALAESELWGPEPTED